MSVLGIILVVILVLLLVGGLPQLGVYQGGYGPAGIVTVLLIVVLILALTGRL